MTLVEFVPPTPHPLWKLCPQMGITDVVVKVNPDLTGLPDPWRLSTLRSIVERLKVEGLKVVGLEGDPFDMTPIKEYCSSNGNKDNVELCNCGNMETTINQCGIGSTPAMDNSAIPQFHNSIIPQSPNPSAALRLCVNNKCDDLREEALSHYRELLESMGRLGIKLLCYNFMVGKGWSRTGVREGRGGAKATYFSTRSTCSTRLKLSHDQVWANYEYFIKAVMPTAEKCGVRMALHPDDPCLPSLGGYARIFGSVEAYDRAYAIYPSPSNAVTFCQANFKLMLGNGERVMGNGERGTGNGATEELVKMIRHFGKRIAFIHVRDVEGTKEDFTELFHDQGDTDQFALMRTYREIGFDVPVRGDHVPEMAYDRELTPEGTPGYFTLGRLFANGYLKALMKGTGN